VTDRTSVRADQWVRLDECLHQRFAVMWLWAVGSWLVVCLRWDAGHGLAKNQVDMVPGLW